MNINRAKLILILTFSIIIISSCGFSRPREAELSSSEKKLSSEAVKKDEVASKSSQKELLKDNLKETYNLVYYGNIRNDTTGNWRYSIYSSNDSQEKLALDYYKAFFDSDNEIHALINASLNTTARISFIPPQTLDVTIFEYKKDEEYDASALFSGNILNQYHINIKSNEINEINTKNSNNDTDSISSTNDETKLEEFKKTADKLLTESKFDGYKIEQNKNIVMVYIWMDGVSDAASALATGASNDWDAWDKTISSAETLAKIMYDNFKKRGISDDYHLSLLILNDSNQDRVLVTFLDGKLYEDSVKKAYKNNQ